MREGVRRMIDGGRWIPDSVLAPSRSPSHVPLGMKSRAFGLTFEYQRASCLLATVALLLSVAACADKPIPPVNSYCVVKPTEAIDMRDPGLQSLWPANQGAVLTGDDNFRQICQRTNSPGGPR